MPVRQTIQTILTASTSNLCVHRPRKKNNYEGSNNSYCKWHARLAGTDHVGAFSQEIWWSIKKIRFQVFKWWVHRKETIAGFSTHKALSGDSFEWPSRPSVEGTILYGRDCTRRHMPTAYKEDCGNTSSVNDALKSPSYAARDLFRELRSLLQPALQTKRHTKYLDL